MLHHTSDSEPGWSRRLSGKRFVFHDKQGRRLKGIKNLERCLKLGIPPAYKNVWICPDPKGHLQATAIDSRGRKQYFYHKDWKKHQDSTKYHGLVAFAEVLGVIRGRVARDLSLPGMPKDKVLAVIVKLLDTTYIRIGNEEYARENKSYGLTTLLKRHFVRKHSEAWLVFKGKSGVVHKVPIGDKRLRKIVLTCQELPGQELFEYLNEAGEAMQIGSEDVNEYLQTVSKIAITAKDFRTWHGTVIAANILGQRPLFKTQTECRQNMVEAIKSTAEALGNTAAICKKCYIHPKVLELYTAGDFHLPNKVGALQRKYGRLHMDELKVLSLLEKW